MSDAPLDTAALPRDGQEHRLHPLSWLFVLIAQLKQFILPLLVLTDPSKWTLPLGVAQYSSEHSADTAAILAFTTLSMVPALLFFLAAQRRIVGGLSGAVKG